MNQLISKQTLFLHFAGQATPLQQKAIDDWLRQPDNLEFYFLCLEEWERLQLQYEATESEGWDHLWQQVSTYEAQRVRGHEPDETVPVLPMPQPRRWLGSGWMVAASLTFLLLGSLAYLHRTTILYRTIETAFGEIRRDTLPDGSTITLNANSTLRYARFGFGDRNREVFLTGEGVFSVRHLPTHQPFVVRTGKGFDVTVLGTEFSVFARSRGARVVLNKGKIQIDYHNAAQPKRMLLQPGDVLAFDRKGSPKKSHTPRPELHAAWQQQRYVFSETSLLEIANLLEENYGLNVTIQDETLAHRTISGTYQATNADQLLEAVTQLLEINYNRQNNDVLLVE